MAAWRQAVSAALAGRLSRSQAVALADAPVASLCTAACELRERGKGRLVTYSPKVFIPLTKLCRDVCHYCTFARPPRRGERAYMSEDEVLAVARAGAASGCHEALFTLGDKPELRYRAARAELAALGCETTHEYLARCARLVVEQTGLLPHLNPGVMDSAQLRTLRSVSVSQGLMLESAAERLAARGGPHFGSPDKIPARRLETIRAAGRARVPFTSGILIGIGESRAERLESLLAIRAAGARASHVQEVIVQNFRAKPGTRMAGHPEPPLDEILWSAAAARLVLGASANVQVPPNLSFAEFGRLLEAGINDWGGISPVTIDHVNPEAPWPAVEALEQATRRYGLELAPRLPLYPEYVLEAERWVDPALIPALLRRSDASGLAREDGWAAGAPDSRPSRQPGTPRADVSDQDEAVRAGRGARSLLPAAIVSGSGARVGDESVPWPARPGLRTKRRSPVADALAKAANGTALGEQDVVSLLEARGRGFDAACDAADELRRQTCGDEVTYVVTRNINYTNVCYFRCGFCAFSKGKLAANLRGKPYVVPTAEVVRRAREAWDRGAVEVCLQGGIHPAFTGRHYIDLCHAIKRDVPGLHIHAFSALEVWQGAATLGLPLGRYLAALRDAGLASLPGTAAEILDDDVRRVICPDKVTTRQWLAVHDSAHRAGLRSTATVMVGHAAARLALHPWITNIQASWVKLGVDGAAAALAAGCNDLGGTLMNESISRAAGASHGQELSPERMEQAIRALGRTPRQRTTLYGRPDAERVASSFRARPLSEPVNPPARESGLVAPPRLVRPGFAGVR